MGRHWLRRGALGGIGTHGPANGMANSIGLKDEHFCGGPVKNLCILLGSNVQTAHGFGKMKI
jgi:hypothetical protein